MTYSNSCEHITTEIDAPQPGAFVYSVCSSFNTDFANYILSETRKYKRLKRLCPYCNSRFFNLPRHIKTLHSDVPAVKDALTSQNPRRNFARIRNEGIVKYNKNQAATGEGNFEFVKRPEDEQKLVHCGNCQGSYPMKYFYRHKKNCVAPEETPVRAVKVAVMLSDETDEQFLDILNSFQET